MIKGIPFDFGARTLVIPPLSLGVLEAMQKQLEAFESGGTSIADVRTVIDAAHAALRRNYPALTREEVAELIDLGNMLEVMQAVMDTSGLRRKQLEAEAAAAGEAPAPTIGAASTPG